MGRKVQAILTVAVTAATAGLLTTWNAPVAVGANQQVDKLQPFTRVNVAQIAAAPIHSSNVQHLEVEKPKKAAPVTGERSTLPKIALGGATAPPSQVAAGGDNGSFAGIDLNDMETGGTNKYANTNGGLEPPDQGLCVGNGFVMEAVNDSLRVYNTSGNKLTTPSIPLAQFFGLLPNAGITIPPSATDFISDPRCYYDPPTKRWFATILDLTEPVTLQFMRDYNYIAVSDTTNPLGAWTIYRFDVTDDGTGGSPLHPGCLGGPNHVLPGCLGDQPLIGADANGIFISDNEYAFAQVLPIAPPVIPPFQQSPDVGLRSGVGQLYALSKTQLESGSATNLVRFDTSTVPFPGPTNDHPWQSIQPASQPPGDDSVMPGGGAEYFLSDIGLPVSPTVSNQIAVWSWTNTVSLGGAPNLTLQHVVINTASPQDTFFVPDPTFPSSTPFYAYQKQAPAPSAYPMASAAGDAEEVLNANDDRMNAVSLAHGRLWAGVNTQLPAADPNGAGHAPDPRVGIMYFDVIPFFSGPTLQATMERDGYINVPRNNVVFPSFGARPDGATIATFTLAGLDYYPSLAWARLDGLGTGQGPVVHVSRLGQAPEDGFTGLGPLGQQGLPDVPPCSICVARWGDYTYSAIDEAGCTWGAAEYIPSGTHDSKGAGDWGTGIHHICPPAITKTSQPITVAQVPLPNTSGRSSVPPLGPVLLAIAAVLGLGLLLDQVRRGISR